jgi:hypothetical protein
MAEDRMANVSRRQEALGISFSGKENAFIFLEHSPQAMSADTRQRGRKCSKQYCLLFFFIRSVWGWKQSGSDCWYLVLRHVYWIEAGLSKNKHSFLKKI